MHSLASGYGDSYPKKIASEIPDMGRLGGREGNSMASKGILNNASSTSRPPGLSLSCARVEGESSDES